MRRVFTQPRPGLAAHSCGLFAFVICQHCRRRPPLSRVSGAANRQREIGGGQLKSVLPSDSRSFSRCQSGRGKSRHFGRAMRVEGGPFELTFLRHSTLASHVIHIGENILSINILKHWIVDDIKLSFSKYIKIYVLCECFS